MTAERAFVASYLEAIGATVRSGPVGELSVSWPPTHVEAFGPRSTIAFDPAVADISGAELCVVGSHLMDRIVEDCSRRGFHCIARVEAKGAPSPAEVLAANLAFPNATTSIRETQEAVVPFLLFNFRVSIVTDETREILRSVLINAQTREPHAVAQTFLDESLTVPEEPLVAPEDLDGAYLAACAELERGLAAEVQKVRTETVSLLEAELARIDTYYAASIEELEARRGPPPLDAIRTFEAERERRKEDARRKLALSVRSRLVNARTLLLPMTMMKVRIANRAASRDAEFEYDAVSLDVSRPSCDACGALLTTVHLCSAGHLVCDDSRQPCAFCDSIACSLCRADVLAQCNVCVRPTCPDHTYVDEIGRRPYCPDHIHGCAICGRMVAERYLSRCATCGQSYCPVDVDPTTSSCATCRSATPVSRDHPDVVRATSPPGSPKRIAAWWRGENGRCVVLFGEGTVFDYVFTLDTEGEVIHRRKGRNLRRRS